MPGFFGFTSLNELPYFSDVERTLGRALAARGIDARVTALSTRPTGSLRARAAHLAEAIAHAAPRADTQLHLIGHSTGGLDLRLLAAPGASLPTLVDVDGLARRIATLTSIATPHFGTPLASFFCGPAGRRVLQLFALVSMSALQHGRLPIALAARVAGFAQRLQSGRMLRPSSIEAMHRQLLAGIDETRRAEIEGFLREVAEDQDLLTQITPESLDLFNALTADRPGVRYGSVLVAGPTPLRRSILAAGLDPYALATRALYGLGHRLSSRPLPAAPHPRHPPRPDATAAAAAGTGTATATATATALVRISSPITPESDGIVPTRSQTWGEVIHTARGDHLDVVGYFHDPHGDPPHHDWLASASGFGRADFERLWTEVAGFIAGACPRVSVLPELRATELRVTKPLLRRAARRQLTIAASLGALGFVVATALHSTIGAVAAGPLAAALCVAAELAIAIVPGWLFLRWVPLSIRVGGRRVFAIAPLRGRYEVEGEGPPLVLRRRPGVVRRAFRRWRSLVPAASHR